MTTPIKSSPEMRVLCYPESAIPRLTHHSDSVNDVLSGLLRRGRGESAGTPNDDYTEIGKEWGDQTEFVSISRNLMFVTLGSVSNIGLSRVGEQGLEGFVAKPREVFQNCVMLPEQTNGTSAVRDPEINPKYEKLKWIVEHGSGWKTWLPEIHPLRTRIYATALPDTATAAITESILLANQQLRFDIGWRGICRDQTKPGALRITWADEWALVWRQDAPMVLERLVNGEWVNVQQFDDAGISTFRGDQTVWIYRWFGYMVIRIGRRIWTVVDWRGAKSEGSRNKVPIPVSWPKGPLRVRTFGVLATVGVALLSNTDQQGKALEPSFVRRIDRTIKGAAAHAATGEITGYGIGWQTKDAKIVVKMRAYQEYMEYSCTLKASKNGIDSPGVHTVVGHWAATHTTVDDSPIDIMPAVLGGNYDGAEPDIMPGAEMSIDVDRLGLDDWAERQGINWLDYVKEHHPIEVHVRWRYSDGSTDPWTVLIRGYVVQVQKSTNGIADRKMKVVIRDPVHRLQKENAFINTRFTALDYFYLKKFSQARPGQRVGFWGGEGVQEMLRIQLGNTIANQMNGTGNPMEYQPRNQPPLLSPANDVTGLSLGSLDISNGFTTVLRHGLRFPPPWGEDVIKWIKEIAELEHAVFFFGYNPAVPTLWPVPIYGRILNIIAGRTPHTLPDSVYIEGDWNSVQQGVDTTTIPGRNINTVEVWSSHPQLTTGIQGIAPVVSSGRATARLPADDPNSAERSWERTRLIREKFLIHKEIIEALAIITMQEYRGVKLQHPRLVLRGDVSLQWGEEVRPRMEKIPTLESYDISDQTIGLHNGRFRVGKVNHSFNFTRLSPDSWRTTIYVRPLSASGF